MRTTRLLSALAASCVVLSLVPATLGQGHEEERRVIVNRMEVMQHALPALMEAQRLDAVDTLCRAILAHDMMLNDRTDAAARIIRARNPEMQQVLDLLRMAEELYREFGAHDKADTIRRNVEQLWLQRLESRERAREDHGHDERAMARRTIEIMRLGVHGLVEADRHDAAHQLEMAIHARELDLEGRRDEEAMHVRETAPDLGAQIELLNFAADLWDEFGHESKAGQLRELAAHFRQAWERRREGAEREHRPDAERRHRAEDERAAAMHHLEVMRMALGAFREAGDEGAADAMHRVIRAREVRLEGREDREAREIMEHSPGRDDQVELLRHAANILRGFGAGEKAAACDELAELFTRGRDARRPGPDDERARQIAELEEQMHHLRRAMEEMMERLEHLRRDGR